MSTNGNHIQRFGEKRAQGIWLSALGLLLTAPLAQGATVQSGSITTLVSANAGLCLGIKGGTAGAGALLQSQGCSGNTFQQWKLIEDQTGYYQVMNVGSGLCIDVTGGSTANGTNLQQWGCSPVDHQRWQVSDQGNGMFSLLSKFNGLAIDLFDNSTENGARIVQWAFHGGVNQKWKAPGAVISTGVGPVSGSVIALKGVQAGNCIGVKGGSASAGASLQSQGCSGSVFQQWKAIKDAVGDYDLVNIGSGQCMDVPSASTVGGVKIQQWSCSGQAMQKWRFNDDGNGHFYITSKVSGLALDVLNSSTANGADIVQWKYLDNANQQWIAAGGSDTPPVPPAPAGPVGFAAGTTGGNGGEVVRVTTPAQLAFELCRTRTGNTCTDKTPRIIEVAGTLDFRGTEGSKSEQACLATRQCPAPMQSEYILGTLGACNGKPIVNKTLDTAAGSGMLIGSNKTLTGVGSTATIRGKGLTLHGGVSNIIIRNLTITDLNPQVVWGGDAITLDDVDRVWIDHNRISLIGRQFIVSGWGKASRVTISWNEFDGRTPYSASCDGTHYWMMLMIGLDDSVTLANNWIHHFGGRSPHVGTTNANAKMALHMYNNYFQTSGGHGLDASANFTSVLAEGNYYAGVSQPVAPGGTAVVMAPLTNMSSSVTSACNNALNRSCVGNIASPMPSGGASTFPTNSAALARFSGQSRTVVPVPYPASDVPRVVPASAGPGKQ